MTDEPARRLLEIADELRAIAANGLYYSADHHDRARYDQVRQLAVRTRELVDRRDTAWMSRVLSEDLTVRTPLISADVAVFDAADRMLLLRRSDCGQWCMPGGAAEVGETPSRAAEREAFEETTVTVRAHSLLGVYDNRRLPLETTAHMYHLVFGAEVESGTPGPTTEALECGWFDRRQASTLDFYRGHTVKVPQMFAIRHGDIVGPVFHLIHAKNSVPSIPVPEWSDHADCGIRAGSDAVEPFTVVADAVWVLTVL